MWIKISLYFKNKGAFVDRFYVEYFKKDESGNERMVSWNSGSQTSGYKSSVLIPGDASKIRVRIEGATGLVWEPWRTAYDKYLSGVPKPDAACFIHWGTTLDQRISVEDEGC